MDLHYNLDGFDISELVKSYRGKDINTIFSNHRIVKNEMGEFMELYWDIRELSNNFNLSKTKNRILTNLKTVFCVGENYEQHFLKRGIKNLYDLKHNLRFSRAATKILELIKARNHSELQKNNHIHDIDLSFCFQLRDMLFLDIETLGICDSPMIMVGFGFFDNGVFKIRILFARKIEEEIAMCEYLKNEIFPAFKCFVTYNGKSFDIPFISNRMLYFFDDNPLISEEYEAYKHVNTLFHHIDLYHGCRRKYKGLFRDYTLTTIEQELLGWVRENELPSSLVGECYRKYQSNPERYSGLIKEAIEHNYYDIYSMPLIYKKLLE